MKARILNTIIAIAAILTFGTACQREDFLLPEGSVAQDGYVNLRFNVDVPDMDQVQTRAVDPDGGGVQQISVFCFDRNSLFITVTTVKVVSDSESLSLSGTFEVSVPEHTVTLQLVGNQNLTYFKEENYRGMSEVDVMSSLEASAGRMIYWARKTVAELRDCNTPEKAVRLLRNQAKISMAVASDVDFKEHGWIIVNTNAFGTVAPFNPETGKFEAPTHENPFVTLPDNNAKLADYLDVRELLADIDERCIAGIFGRENELRV